MLNHLPYTNKAYHYATVFIYLFYQISIYKYFTIIRNYLNFVQQHHKYFDNIMKFRLNYS